MRCKAIRTDKVEGRVRLLCKDQEFEKNELQNTPMCTVEEIKKKYARMNTESSSSSYLIVCLFIGEFQEGWRLQIQKFSSWRRLT